VRKMIELGISSLGHVNDYKYSGNFTDSFDLLYKSAENCLKFSEENDIRVCEILIEAPEILSNEHKLKFVDMCSNFSIKKQIHAPYVDINPASYNLWIRKASVDCYIECAKVCKAIGGNCFTIHPGSAKYVTEKIKSVFQEKMLLSVNEILDAIKDLKLLTCIENMQKKTGILLDFDEIDMFFTKINREDIFLTWDTSHYWTCNADFPQLWEKYHEIIKNIHIVDNTEKKSDVHPALGAGKIDFQQVFDLAQKYEYSGSMIMEIGSAKNIPKSLEFINKFF